MSFTYKQSTGVLIGPNDAPLGVGYSGNGAQMNNPESQDVTDHGPIPQGWYTIQPPSVHPKLGPVAMALVPDAENEMFGRGDFFIHGDNTLRNFTASEGCIVMNHLERTQIATSVLAGDSRLEVVA